MLLPVVLFLKLLGCLAVNPSDQFNDDKKANIGITWLTDSVPTFPTSPSSNAIDDDKLECDEDIRTLSTSDVGLAQTWLVAYLGSRRNFANEAENGLIYWPDVYGYCQLFSNSSLPFDGQYCEADVVMNFTEVHTVRFKLGLCIPVTCSEEFVDKAINSIRDGLQVYENRTISVNVSSVYCPFRHNSMSICTIACLTFIAASVGLVMVATICSYKPRRKVDATTDETLSLIGERSPNYGTNRRNSDHFQARRRTPSSASPKMVHNTSFLSVESCYDDDGSRSRRRSQQQPQADDDGISVIEHVMDSRTSSIMSKRLSTAVIAINDEIISSRVERVRLLNCFALNKRVEELLRPDTGEPFACLHGLRVLSTLWFICNTTLRVALSKADIPLGSLKQVENSLLLYPFIKPSFAVTTVLAVVGFHVCHTYFDRRSNGPQNWFRFFGLELVTWWPVNAMVVWITVSLMNLDFGPTWTHNDQWSLARYDGCPSTWWMNLLFVNNFSRDECMMWTWYLAIGAQLYLICPIFLITLYKIPLVGVVLSATSVTVASLIVFLRTINNNLDVTSTLVIQPNSTMTYYYDVYSPPFYWVSPFVLGLLTAYMCSRKREALGNMRTTYVVVGWVVACTCLVVPVYVSYVAAFNVLEASLDNCFSQTIWSIGICWIIFACLTQKDTLVNTILSSPFWSPLSKLSYCAYMTHPLMVTLYFDAINAPVILSQWTFFAFFGSAVFWSYMVAIPFHIIYEASLTDLVKSYFNWR